MRTYITFNVAPRYSGGSPAPVNEITARRVAREERAGFDATMEGIYGAEAARVAAQDGLGGIVEARWERGNGWLIQDMLTNEVFYRHHSWKRPSSAAREKARSLVMSYVNRGALLVEWREDASTPATELRTS